MGRRMRSPQVATTVARSREIPEGGRLVLDVDGTEIGIFRIGGKLYAYSNYCQHAGGPICQGVITRRITEIVDGARQHVGEKFSDIPQIVCPWHGYEYSLYTGEHPGNPKVRLRSFAVSERGGEIIVEL